MGSAYKYHDVGSDSDTLLSDSEQQRIEGDENARRTYRSKRILSTIRAYWWIIDIAGFFTIVTLLLGLYERRQDQNEITGDLTGFAPRFSQQITTFKPDTNFIPENPDDWFTDKVQNTWIDLVPVGLGYVRVDNPSDYSNLPVPLKVDSYAARNLTVYTTSMTHQLHCLHSVTHVFYSFTSNPPKTPPKDMVWHLQHCFDYLRQSIMCSGDVALEGDATTFPKEFVGSDGWDAKHVCRDYSQIKKYLEENRVDDEKWI